MRNFLLLLTMLIVSIPTYSAGIGKKLLYEINYKDLSGYSDNKLPAGVIQNIQVGTANLAGNSFALVFIRITHQ